MRWLLVLLACCFCCLSYAGTTSCNDRCKGYYAKNANFYHNSDGSYNLICEDCDSNVHYGPEIGFRESFFCSYSGHSCSCCGAAYCVWHSCYGVADGGETYKDRSLCQACNNTGSCSDCGQNFCSVHNNHKKECEKCGEEYCPNTNHDCSDTCKLCGNTINSGERHNQKCSKCGERWCYSHDCPEEPCKFCGNVPQSGETHGQHCNNCNVDWCYSHECPCPNGPDCNKATCGACGAEYCKTHTDHHERECPICHETICDDYAGGHDQVCGVCNTHYCKEHPASECCPNSANCNKTTCKVCKAEICSVHSQSHTVGECPLCHDPYCSDYPLEGEHNVLCECGERYCKGDHQCKECPNMPVCNQITCGSCRQKYCTTHDTNHSIGLCNNCKNPLCVNSDLSLHNNFCDTCKRIWCNKHDPSDCVANCNTDADHCNRVPCTKPGCGGYDCAPHSYTHDCKGKTPDCSNDSANCNRVPCSKNCGGYDCTTHNYTHKCEDKNCSNDSGNCNRVNCPKNGCGGYDCAPHNYTHTCKEKNCSNDSAHCNRVYCKKPGDTQSWDCAPHNYTHDCKGQEPNCENDAGHCKIVKCTLPRCVGTDCTFHNRKHKCTGEGACPECGSTACTESCQHYTCSCGDTLCKNVVHTPKHVHVDKSSCPDTAECKIKYCNVCGGKLCIGGESHLPSSHDHSDDPPAEEGEEEEDVVPERGEFQWPELEFWDLLKDKLIPTVPSSFGSTVTVSKPSLYDLPGMPGSGAMMGNALGNAMNYNISALAPEMAGAEGSMFELRSLVRLFTKLLLSLTFVVACIRYVNK